MSKADKKYPPWWAKTWLWFLCRIDSVKRPVKLSRWNGPDQEFTPLPRKWMRGHSAIRWASGKRNWLDRWPHYFYKDPERYIADRAVGFGFNPDIQPPSRQCEHCGLMYEHVWDEEGEQWEPDHECSEPLESS